MRHPSFVAGSLYLVFLLTSCSKPSSTEPVVRPAIVEHPSVFQAAVSETYAGQTRPRHESTLSFRVSGKIQARSVEVGHHVRQGQVLASLDSGDYRLQVEAAQAALGAAQAELNLAKSEFDRHADLLSKKMISQAFYEVRENAWKAAQSRVTQARSMLQASRNQEDYAQLRADADGVVTAVLVEVGQVVLSGTPVIELAQDGDVEVALSVSENRISGLKLKQLVWTEFWALPGQRFQGEIRELSPMADARTRTYDVRVKLLNATHVQLGMTARVYVGAQANINVFLVPLSALHEKEGKPALWLVDPQTKKMKLVGVEVGEYREQGVTIHSGVSASDWVAVVGVHKLSEGQIIRPIDRHNQDVTL